MMIFVVRRVQINSLDPERVPIVTRTNKTNKTVLLKGYFISTNV